MVPVKRTLLYTYEHAARLSATAMLDIAYRLVPQYLSLFRLITVCLDRIPGSDTSAEDQRRSSYCTYPRSDQERHAASLRPVNTIEAPRATNTKVTGIAVMSLVQVLQTDAHTRHVWRFSACLCISKSRGSIR
jgi:hypothetical protein